MACKRKIHCSVVLRASKGREDPYLKALSDADLGPVHFVPVLQYEFLNESELHSDLLTADKFSGLVFTSQTSVDACIQSLSSILSDCGERMNEQWRDLPVFVVGEATAHAVTKLALSPCGSFSGNADALSKVIIEYFSTREQKPTKPLLFPCGNLRKETLPLAMEEAGIGLKTLVCYRTLPHSEIGERLKSVAIQSDVDHVWVIFFSPSGVAFALEQVQAIFSLDKLLVAAIGPTTADSLLKSGAIPHVVARQPTADSLVEGILTHTQSNNTSAS